MNKLQRNIVSGFFKQVIAILYGFILPRLILVAYGSKVNGLINSITQFMTLISCLDLGVNAVVQSALYRPLAEGNNQAISEILSSARKFFNTLARVLVIYVIALCILYPNQVRADFGRLYVIVIIIALSIGSFAEFFFGIVNQTLLRADQKGYIYDWLSVLVYLLTTITGIVLIKAGASIQTLKLITAAIFLIRPVYIGVYVKNHYAVDFHAVYEEEPIKQKWYGMAQHFSAIVIDSTDVVVLTLFSTLQNVSIYSVYNLVVSGVKTLLTSITHGVSAHFGNIIAVGDRNRLTRSFARMEWTIHTATIVIFGCTSVLIVPFVKLYTKGISDVDYIVPLFAGLITAAQMMRCIRLPYNIVILAAGHYKQTQSNYIVAAVMNIAISVLLVIRLGLVGVAIGTIAAFMYQNIWMARYISKNIVFWSLKKFTKQHLVDALVILPAYAISSLIKIPTHTYLEWIGLACVVFLLWLLVSFAVNCLFYKEHVRTLVERITGHFVKPIK